MTWLYGLAVILAEGTDPATALGGNSGWVGAGLLGAVLGWLMFVHLPAKDRLFSTYIASKDAETQGIVGRQWETAKTQQEHYRSDLKTIADSYKAQMEGVVEQFRTEQAASRGDLKIIAEHCRNELEAVTFQFNTELNTFKEVLASLRAFAEQLQDRRLPGVPPALSDPKSPKIPDKLPK